MSRKKHEAEMARRFFHLAQDAERKESRMWDSSASAKNLADPIERPTDISGVRNSGWSDTAILPVAKLKETKRP